MIATIKLEEVTASDLFRPTLGKGPGGYANFCVAFGTFVGI
jgi:hypothetical protein